MTARPHASLGRRLLPAVMLTTAASGLVALLDQPSTGSATDVSDEPDGRRGSRWRSCRSHDAAPGVIDNASGSRAALPTHPQPTATSAPAAAVLLLAVNARVRPSMVPTIDTRWGPVQVEAVVSSSGQICDVDAIQSPNDHGRSVRINQQALPILHDEVMDAQSARIDNVSGATITTRGYEQSLQSILDGVGG